MTETVAMQLTGMTLPGKRSKRQWTVGERIAVPSDQSQPNFSVGYHATGDDGTKAFLKAADLNLLTLNGESLFDRMHAAMSSHKFERDILDHCSGSSMDRIVLAIDYGDLAVKFNNVQDAVFYLVFELAKHDLRRHYDKNKGFTLAWALGSLHEMAIGIDQLHSGQVTHNDLKPANFLVFADDARKISDLGCATSPIITAIHNDKHDPGDIKYAAPELLYASTIVSQRELCTFPARRAADLYNLGSMVFYLLTGSMLTPQVVNRLALQHRPNSSAGGWNGDWADAMPYWREAFGRVIQDAAEGLKLAASLAISESLDEIFVIIGQLCEPDSTLRGHPQNKQGSQDPYGLQRFISAFNRLKTRATIAQNG